MPNIADKLSGIIFGMFGDMLKSLLEPFAHIHSLSDLVFGTGTDMYLTFTNKEWTNIIIPGEDLMKEVAWFAIMCGLIYISTMISRAGINPVVRTNVLEMMGALLFVNFMIQNLNSFYSILFNINGTMVHLFQAKIGSNGVSFPVSGSGLGWILLWCVYTGLSIWANIYYLMREFTLILLMIFGPLFISLFLFHPFRAVTGAWVRELFATIIVQGIHSGVLWVFLGFVQGTTTDSNGIPVNNYIADLTILASFIPISEGIKALFGLQAGITGKASMFAAATGAAGLGAVFSAGKAALGQESPLDRLSERYMDGKGKSTAGSGGDSSSGGSESVSQSSPMSAKTARMLQVGKVGANLGKGLGTLMGAAVGMPLGPAGTLIGGAVGGNIGSPVGGLATRTAMAGVDGAGKVYQNVQEGIVSELSQLDKYGVSPTDPYGGGKKAIANLSAAAVGTGKGLAKSTTGVTNLGKVGKAAAISASQGFSLDASPVGRIRNAVNAGIGGANTAVQEIAAASGGLAEFKKQGLETAGYLGGVIGGERGAQMGAKMASHLSPIRGINQQIQQQGWEASDLSKGIESQRVRNVRVAVTRDSSCLVGEVGSTSTDGSTSFQEQRLSDYRGGDSSLAEGQVVYRDYQLNEGRLVPSESQGTFFYSEDSQGGKMKTNKEYQMNPYDYLENRNRGSEKYFRPDRFKQGIV